MATKSACTSGLSAARVKSFPIVACVLPWLQLQEGLGTKEHKSIRDQPSLASQHIGNSFFFFFFSFYVCIEDLQYQIRKVCIIFLFLNQTTLSNNVQDVEAPRI